MIKTKTDMQEIFFGQSERRSFDQILLGGNLNELGVWNFRLIMCEGINEQ